MSSEVFYHAHVTGSDWRSICDLALQAIPQDTSGSLGFIYIADELAGDTDRIVDYLRSRTGVTHWVGSVAQGLCSTGKETYNQAAIAIMLTDLDKDDFRIMPAIADDPSEWLSSIDHWRQHNMATVAVVHGDPTHTECSDTITKLSDQLEGGFLLGGITSAENLPIQIADIAVGQGVSGVLFSAKINIATGLSQGCNLIGQKHVITESQRNIIITLDKRPALEVLKEEIGEELARDLQQIGGLIFAALPIPNSDTGDYLVRNLVGIDPEQKLVAIGDAAHIDNEIQFARRDTDSAREDLVHMLESLKQRLPGKPKGALYHTCLGRGEHLFGKDSAELKLIQEHIGDVPLIGFYASGEISHRRLYGYTGVLTVFC